MSGLIKSVVEGIGQDILTDKANEYAGSHFQPTKDPFYEKITLPNGETKEVKRKLPKELFSKKESKAWKSIQNKAWMHDRSMCGCCCWTDTIGWAPLLALLPVIGPAVMYSIHNKLTTLADKEFNLPLELKAKMHGNIAIDLCISLIPILGTLFSWLHTCSTRNAAMVYNFIVQRALEQQQTNLQRDQVLQQTQQQQRQQMEKMKQNSNANNNSKNRVNVRNNQKENYEMRNLNSSSHNSSKINSKTSIPAPQQARYRSTPQQQRYNAPPQQQYDRPPQQRQRYNTPPPHQQQKRNTPPPQQQRYNRPPVSAPQQQYQSPNNNYNRSNNNNEYYEPKQHNLPYPTEDTDFY